MNAKVLSSLSAALIVASWVSPAMAEPVGEHPKLDWSAAIGTGHAAGTIETSHNRTDSAEPNTAPTHSSEPHWTASIGTGTAATSPSAVPNTNAPASSGTQPIVAATHWTSRIGSGHPFASASPVKYTSVANTR
jgi:hypothetical protein